ncbi:hypothetical protein [Aeromonas phage ZPAH34]|uniref:hypothetical protein n=1 Tax=Aeromonas phage ZPAH34 TaxID=2924888 RepID=UPI00232975E6|nr:hypothetical protein PQD16_gp143 [Aeromonas phage ZPAH34]UOX39540.1 hypothetical protein [Aeromonas phage ZPAH34]
MNQADNLETTLGPVDVRVDLSAPQVSVTGKALFHLLYNNDQLFKMAPNHIGSPHNGGEHTFCLTGPRQEVNAWLDLFAEEYPTTANMINYVKRHIHKEFLQGNWRKYNRINIKLKDLKWLERKDHQDIPVAVLWFKSEMEKL